MSDLYLVPTDDGGEIELINAVPTLTSGLGNAVYLSLWTSAWWGNAVSDESQKFRGTLSEIMTEPLTVSARNNAIVAVKAALKWMLDDGIASDITVEAEIYSAGRLNMRIVIEEPERTSTFAYGLNWDAQEVEISQV